MMHVNTYLMLTLRILNVLNFSQVQVIWYGAMVLEYPNILVTFIFISNAIYIAQGTTLMLMPCSIFHSMLHWVHIQVQKIWHHLKDEFILVKLIKVTWVLYNLHSKYYIWPSLMDVWPGTWPAFLTYCRRLKASCQKRRKCKISDIDV